VRPSLDPPNQELRVADIKISAPIRDKGSITIPKQGFANRCEAPEAGTAVTGDRVEGFRKGNTSKP